MHGHSQRIADDCLRFLQDATQMIRLGTFTSIDGSASFPAKGLRA
jgi:hypothetical protein